MTTTKTTLEALTDLDCPQATIEGATSADLVRALGAIADGAPEGDEPTLYALDAILVELGFRPDVDRASRRWLDGIHRGVLAQL